MPASGVHERCGMIHRTGWGMSHCFTVVSLSIRVWGNRCATLEQRGVRGQKASLARARLWGTRWHGAQETRSGSRKSSLKVLGLTFTGQYEERRLLFFDAAYRTNGPGLSRLQRCFDFSPFTAGRRSRYCTVAIQPTSERRNQGVTTQR
jgi:hypothetical protein